MNIWQRLLWTVLIFIGMFAFAIPVILLFKYSFYLIGDYAILIWIGVLILLVQLAINRADK